MKPEKLAAMDSAAAHRVARETHQLKWPNPVASEVESFIRKISTPNIDAMASVVRRMVPLEWTEEQQFKAAVAMAYGMGKAGMNGLYEGHAYLRRIRGHRNSLEKRQAKADERDRAAFYDCWWKRSAGCISPLGENRGPRKTS